VNYEIKTSKRYLDIKVWLALLSALY
jgi:hypothetical protein